MEKHTLLLHLLRKRQTALYKRHQPEQLPQKKICQIKHVELSAVVPCELCTALCIYQMFFFVCMSYCNIGKMGVLW